jgi:membrane peptidoglycan carboxypeptidase
VDESRRAIDARNAFVMNSLMQEVTRSGTAARAQATLKRNDLFGKTGTTNDSFDAWFAGFPADPGLVAVVWIGYDHPRKLGDRETGGGLALPVWIEYMQTALRGRPALAEPPRPTNSQGNAGPPQVSLTPTGGGLGVARPWGRSVGGKHQRLAGLHRQLPRQRREELVAPAGVAPGAVHPAEVVSTGACRQPQLVQRRLGVDHHLGSVRETQLQQSAGTMAVDVDHIVLQPGIRRGLDAGQNLGADPRKLAVVHFDEALAAHTGEPHVESS